jgi:spore coat protein U-like protein
MKLKQSILAAAMLVAAAVPMQASAFTSQATMQVFATAVDPITITSDGPLVFGTIQTGSVATATSSFTIHSQGTYTLTFSSLNGNNPDGSYTMIDQPPGLGAPATQLSYTLFSDSTKAIQYSSGIASASRTASLGLLGALTSETVYAETTAANPGSYSDIITVTLTY